MVMPSGRRSAASPPMPKISGKAPSKAARVVIMIGRKRIMQASRIASRGLRPWLRSASRAKSIIMIAFFLTMPISRMMPISAIRLSSLRQRISASSAPTPAEGRVERMVSGCT